MDAFFSGPARSEHGSRFVTSVIEHPRLIRTDPTLVRVFHRPYAQYALEITKRARQLIGKDVVPANVVTPVRLKYCVDGEWHESLIELQYFPNVDS